MKNIPQNPAVWTVDFTAKVNKQKEKLPIAMAERFFLLVQELQTEGPEQLEWHHYGKIVGKKDTHHCHLNKGKPRYVVVWKVTDRQANTMEIIYAGNHENANYRLLG